MLLNPQEPAFVLNISLWSLYVAHSAAFNVQLPETVRQPLLTGVTGSIVATVSQILPEMSAAQPRAMREEKQKATAQARDWNESMMNNLIW